jgi:hypothetical protein
MPQDSIVAYRDDTARARRLSAGTPPPLATLARNKSTLRLASRALPSSLRIRARSSTDRNRRNSDDFRYP